jgi:hypothetical protein
LTAARCGPDRRPMLKIDAFRHKGNARRLLGLPG